MTDALKPCPFCNAPMQVRYALWPAEGDRDAVIHNVSGGTDCPIEGAFSIDTFDNGVSVAEAWNTRPAAVEDGPGEWQNFIKHAIATIKADHGMGDFTRAELTDDYGKPRYDLLQAICATLRDLHAPPSPTEGEAR